MKWNKILHARSPIHHTISSHHTKRHKVRRKQNRSIIYVIYAVWGVCVIWMHRFCLQYVKEANKQINKWNDPAIKRVSNLCTRVRAIFSVANMQKRANILVFISSVDIVNKKVRRKTRNAKCATAHSITKISNSIQLPISIFEYICKERIHTYAYATDYRGHIYDDDDDI